jgi:hypothetical protein
MHSIWTLIIRPARRGRIGPAHHVTNSQNVKAQVIQLRSVYVILKDPRAGDMRHACMWSLLLLGRQAWLTQRDRKLLDKDYVSIGEAQVVLPEDARVHSRPLEALPRQEQDGFPAAPADGGVQPLRRHAQRAGRRRSRARRSASSKPRAWTPSSRW